MKLQDLPTAIKQVQRWRNSCRKALRRLNRAKALLRDTQAVLHSLPEQQRPAELIDRVRLYLHRDDAQPDPQGPQA